MIRALLLVILLTSCYQVPDKIEPRVSIYIEKRHIDTLKSPFPKLTSEERSTDWGKEYAIAVKFAENFDLYRAISTFKRAEALIDSENEDRMTEISYFLFLSYYLGGKYSDALQIFEASELVSVDRSFTPYHDLMLVLYECYTELGVFEKAHRIKELLEESYPETFDDIELSIALKEGDIDIIEEYSPKRPYLNNLLDNYACEKKSVATAQALNLLPGAGYLYLGQKKSALTSFLLNGLFISSSVYFFMKDNIAAGIITASFEAGWYFGGIYGAGESAKYYNERQYEKHATPLMNEKKLFPVFMLQYGF